MTQMEPSSDISKSETITTAAEKTKSSHPQDLDQAHDFLQRHGDTEQLGDAGIKRLQRKVDWHILPLVFFSYFIQALDKQSLNYTAVMGIQKDLHLTKNDFSNAATALFVAILIAELPNAYFLNKVSAAKWLAANCVLWGVATGCTAAARNQKELLTARIFLGIFDAAIQPSMALVSSQYYRKDKQGSRFLLWGSAIGCALIVGGLLSFAFQHVHHAAIAGWKILFTLLGCVSSVFGLSLFWFLPDTPMQARFLSDAEKVALLHHVSVNKTGVRNTHFKAKHILELVRDPQIWMLSIITILTTISGGFTLTYSSTLIAGFGFPSDIAALLNMPSGLVTIIACYVLGQLLNTRLPRAAIIAGTCMLVILGACLMSFAPKTNHAALLAGIYLVNCSTTTFCIMYQWASANVAGQTKRTATMALITACFGAGSLIGPQTFQANDAPGYVPAKITLIVTQAGTAALAVVLAIYYYWINRRRDGEHGKTVLLATEMNGDPEAKTWGNLTDRERPSFRYMP